MSTIPSDLEELLLRRLADAMASLPDGGRKRSPERVALVHRTVDDFVREVKRVTGEELVDIPRAAAQKS
ncbi:MAG: hypothetical protein AAF417_14385 [Pseudomonadota bacterium]